MPISFLKRRVDSRIQANEASLKEDYDRKLVEAEKDFDAKVEAAVLERLDFIARPDSQPTRPSFL